MEINPKDSNVVKLLKKLKEANETYPTEMFALRRQGYLRQVAEIGGGAGLAWGLRNTVKSVKGSAPPAAGTLLEALLVVAIVAEASAVAYFYRDTLVDFFQSLSKSPKVEEVSNPPVITSPISEFVLTISPVATETEMPVGTPSLGLAAEPTNHGNNNSQEGSDQAVSTQAPNGNNGNQYGHTPKPERTKEPGNNNKDNNNNQDKKSKPTKTK